MIRKQIVFLILLYITLVSANGFSQDEEATSDSLLPTRNILADIGYSTLGIITSNLSLNLMLRMADQSFANTTYESIWQSIIENDWSWEDGDRFLVNQFGHPYQGSTYFASARANGFNFYESILFVPYGSRVWEIVCEPEPSINDFITTTTGGIALGEMLHRLFLEVDSSPSIWAKIGGFFISPISSFNKVYNRPVRGYGGGNIYDLSIRSGIEKTFAFFPGHGEQTDSWNYPGVSFDANVVYGSPFLQNSKTPYEHFELYTGITTNITSYHMAIVSDGYLFSFNPVQTNTAITSTGLSMHFDYFNATNDIIDNLGYGNIQFSSNAVNWTVKHKYSFSQNTHLEIKAHTGITLWGNSMYNGEHIVDDFWVSLGNTRSTFGIGENIKLLFSILNNKAGRLALSIYSYHIFAIPVTEKHSTGNVFFIYSSIGYELPLGNRLAIGLRGTYWGLFGFYDSANNVNRSLVSNCLYVMFKF
jgi:hypothetical protein